MKPFSRSFLASHAPAPTAQRSARRNRPAFFRSGLAAALVMLTAACMTPPINDAARVGPFYTPTNHTGDAVLPANIRRVVLLPLAGGEGAPAASLADLDPVINAALLRENRFEVVTVSRDTCRRLFSVEEFSSVEALPANFVAILRREYAADAVLFVDVTSFRAYRPLAIGLRAKLATLEETRLVWTFDNLFSAADPATANSARRYYLKSGPRDIPADMTPTVLQSPATFAAYAADAMFSTLPPTTPPVPTPSAHPTR